MRNFFSFVELLFWPLVSVISVGLMGDYLELGDETLNFIMTGAIAGGVLQVAQLDVAYSLLYEVWSKSLKQTLLAPVGVTETLFGSWVIGVIRGLFIFVVLSICSVLMFGFTFPALPVTLIFLTGLLMSAFLLGLLVNVVILSFGQKAEITAWMFAYLFMILCGIYYPVEILPAFFKGIAQSIPITYFLSYFRGGSIQDAVIGFALVVFYFIAGLFLLRFAYHRARAKGTIIRLSE
jgi:ABC-2 type transport system permease protein